MIDWNRNDFRWNSSSENNAGSRNGNFEKFFKKLLKTFLAEASTTPEQRAEPEWATPPGYVHDDPPSSEGSGYGVYYRTVQRIVAIPDSTVTEGFTSSELEKTPSVYEEDSSPACHSSDTPADMSTSSGFTQSDALTILTERRRRRDSSAILGVSFSIFNYY